MDPRREHPILRACAAAAAAIKDVAEVNPVFMSTDDKAGALRQLVRLESRLAELRLRVMADAGDLAATTAAQSVAEWLTVHTRSVTRTPGPSSVSPRPSTGGTPSSAAPCVRAR